jgi:hypothetical protein
MKLPTLKNMPQKLFVLLAITLFFTCYEDAHSDKEKEELQQKLEKSIRESNFNKLEGTVVFSKDSRPLGNYAYSLYSKRLDTKEETEIFRLETRSYDLIFNSFSFSPSKKYLALIGSFGNCVSETVDCEILVINTDSKKIIFRNADYFSDCKQPSWDGDALSYTCEAHQGSDKQFTISYPFEHLVKSRKIYMPFELKKNQANKYTFNLLKAGLATPISSYDLKSVANYYKSSFEIRNPFPNSSLNELGFVVETKTGKKYNYDFWLGRFDGSSQKLKKFEMHKNKQGRMAPKSVWSPDQRKLMFWSTMNNDRKIVVINTENMEIYQEIQAATLDSWCSPWLTNDLILIQRYNPFKSSEIEMNIIYSVKDRANFFEVTDQRLACGQLQLL